MKYFFILFILILVFPLGVSGLEFNPIEPFTAPGGEEVRRGTSFTDYLSTIYNTAIGASAILAVIMIVIAGFQYTTSAGKESSISNAKSRIWNAVAGLLLVLGAWIFLFTLNPNFVENTLCIERLDGLGGCVDDGTEPTGGAGGDDFPSGDLGRSIPDAAVVAQICSIPNVSINYDRCGLSDPGPCPPGQTRGCTSLNDLPGRAIVRLEALANDCAQQYSASTCSITVTGGTEGGHQTHGPGIPILDLRKQTVFDEYVENTAVSTRAVPSGTEYRLPNGTRLVDEGTHWHVIF